MNHAMECRVYWSAMGKLSGILAGTLCASFALHAQTVSPRNACADLAKFSVPGVAWTKSEHVAAGPLTAAQPLNLPGHCLVHGVINQRTGAGGHQFGIGFELRLPDAWTERFLFQGGGGMDGFVRTALGGVPISGSTALPALARGFAVASTDSGHQGANGPGGPSADSSFGDSATIASVVRIRPAMDAAFCSAHRTTLVGSSTPI